jgi:hypothetical protein
MRLYDIVPLVSATVVVIASILYDRWRARKRNDGGDATS